MSIINKRFDYKLLYDIITPSHIENTNYNKKKQYKYY